MEEESSSVDGKLLNNAKNSLRSHYRTAGPIETSLTFEPPIVSTNTQTSAELAQVRQDLQELQPDQKVAEIHEQTKKSFSEMDSSEKIAYLKKRLEKQVTEIDNTALQNDQEIAQAALNREDIPELQYRFRSLTEVFSSLQELKQLLATSQSPDALYDALARASVFELQDGHFIMKSLPGIQTKSLVVSDLAAMITEKAKVDWSSYYEKQQKVRSTRETEWVRQEEAEPLLEQPLPLPKGWTTLYHGTNLAREGWDPRLGTLDRHIFYIGSTGLSVVSTEDKEETKNRGLSDTTQTYSGYHEPGRVSRPAELRIVFPKINSLNATPENKETFQHFQQEYGNDEADRILALADKVYWKKPQGARHPILPSGMILEKKAEYSENGRRIIYYVPHNLAELYNNELSRES